MRMHILAFGVLGWCHLDILHLQREHTVHKCALCRGLEGRSRIIFKLFFAHTSDIRPGACSWQKSAFWALKLQRLRIRGQTATNCNTNRTSKPLLHSVHVNTCAILGHPFSVHTTQTLQLLKRQCLPHFIPLFSCHSNHPPPNLASRNPLFFFLPAFPTVLREQHNSLLDQI